MAGVKGGGVKVQARRKEEYREAQWRTDEGGRGEERRNEKGGGRRSEGRQCSAMG
jgi:hypothetical protein